MPPRGISSMLDLEKSSTMTYQPTSSRSRGFVVLLLLIFTCFIHPILRSRDPLSFGLMVFPEPKAKAASPQVASTAKDREYPIAIPDKIDINGEIQPYAGYDVRFTLSNSSEFYESLLSLYEKLENHRLKGLYKLIPPSSWNIPVLEGLNDKNRKDWPGYLDDEAGMDDIAKVLKDRLSNFDLEFQLPIEMSVASFGFVPRGGGWAEIEFSVTGRTDKEFSIVEDLQERLSEKLGYQTPLHDSMSSLSLSIAYMVRRLGELEERELRGVFSDHFQDMSKEFKLENLGLAKFENIFSSKTILPLDRRG
ncbi:hypothetical protein AA313_de0206363 [Arthrobotrys entomopaga]|nr:hypothetical protein AA313_de0206363 [Arthrobotrys entomopaga]